MKNNAEYIHGTLTLTAKDVYFYEHTDISEDDNRLVELSMTTNFDVDAVFGTHVNTSANDETLSCYAYLDLKTGCVRPDLKVILWTDDGWSEEYKYRLNNEEREIVNSKIMEYCQRENISVGIVHPSDKEKEYKYLVGFASDKFLDTEIYSAQLRALWMSYCIHHEINPEAEEYHSDIQALWNTVSEKDTEHWNNFETFKDFLGRDLKRLTLWEKGAQREREFNYLLSFVDEASFESALYCNQLCALWTAYCFHYNLNLDTADYDADMRKLWETVSKTGQCAPFWSDFESFEIFMCENLC